MLDTAVTINIQYSLLGPMSVQKSWVDVPKTARTLWAPLHVAAMLAIPSMLIYKAVMVSLLVKYCGPD